MFNSVRPTLRSYYLIVTVLTLAAFISWQVVTTSTASTGTPSFAPAPTFPETFAKRAAFANTFVQRQEFTNLYASGISNGAYVSALLGRYGLTSITTPDPANPDGTVKVMLTSTDLTNRLNGVGGTLTRAQVLRAIVQWDQLSGNFEAVNAFVASQ